MKLDVVCPGCCGVFHETNENFNPDVPANGTMFDLKEPYKTYSWADFPKQDYIGYGALECPSCGEPYPNTAGFVTTRAQETEPKSSPKPVQSDDLTCPVCGKVCKSKLGLNSHMRSHS